MSRRLRYSISDAPTIREFLRSDAFIRGLLGPFGSGKSSACIWDIVKRGLKQAKGPDGVRRTRWAVIRNCYDDQTEILTELRGWVRFAELSPEDKVATLKDGKELIFEKPSYYYQAPYQGEMIGVRTKHLDLLVTPEHHLWVTKTFGRNREPTEYRHEKASDCYGITYWQMMRNAEIWQGQPQERSLDFFEFLGFWFAEGYAGVYSYPEREIRSEPHYRLTVTQKKDVDYVRGLLTRAGFGWGEHDQGDGCFNFVLSMTAEVKTLTLELAQCGKSRTKAVPAWVKQADREHLLAFLKGYLAGDGRVRQHKRDTTRAWTASPQLADDLQEIALKAGWVANVRSRLRDRPGAWGDGNAEYLVSFLEGRHHDPKLHGGWYKRPYDGMVYCIEVSSHVVYVRRNGAAVWCGQSYPQLRDTTIRTVHQWFPPPTFGRWRANEHEYVINALGNDEDEHTAEIELLFRALDRPDHVRNLLSMDLTGAWVNEAREVPWVIIEAVQGRVDRYPPKRDGGATWAGVLMDTNPPDTDSDWYRFFEETDHSEAVKQLQEFMPDLTVDRFARIFKQPSGLSPQAENAKNQTAGYWHRLAIGKSEEWVKVYVKGEYGFVVDGKAVFPEYHDNIHCPGAADEKRAPVTNDKLPVHRGWDFGLTPACIFSQLSPRGQWKIVDELVATSMGVDRFSDQVLTHSGLYFPNTEFIDTGDPAGEARSQTDERTCFDILRSKGVAIDAGLQSPQIRQESVRKPLRMMDDDGMPAFNIHPRCRRLRKALMGGYHFRKIQLAGSDRFAEVPEKNASSHPAEAMCYTGTRLFGPGLAWRSVVEDDDVALLNSRLAQDRTRSAFTGY